MPTHELVGLILIGIGISEPLVGVWLASRIPNPASGTVIKVALVASGLLLVGLGVALYTGQLRL